MSTGHIATPGYPDKGSDVRIDKIETAHSERGIDAEIEAVRRAARDASFTQAACTAR
jgi:hypothetical protein